MLYLLLPALGIGVYLAWWETRTRAERRLRRRFARAPRRRPALLARLSVHRLTALWTIAAAGAGAAAAVWLLHAPVALGVVAGGSIPAFALELYRDRWRARYEDGVRQAVELGTGILEAGETVEAWVVRGGEAIEGPLRAAFVRGAQQVRERLAVSDWLRYSADTTPSAYWSYVCTGVLSHLEGGGDLVRFFVEVARELQVRERYRRVMAQQQKDATNLLLAMLASPLALYGMFRRPLAVLLAAEPYTQLLFAVALSGYVALFAWARRMARPKRGV